MSGFLFSCHKPRRTKSHLYKICLIFLSKTQTLQLETSYQLYNCGNLPDNYRVTLVVEYLGWVDLDLECSTILLGQ